MLQSAWVSPRSERTLKGVGAGRVRGDDISKTPFREGIMIRRKDVGFYFKHDYR